MAFMGGGSIFGRQRKSHDLRIANPLYYLKKKKKLYIYILFSFLG
jgi:hypothetical protein